MLFGGCRPEKADHTLFLYNRAGLRAYNQVLIPLLKHSLSKEHQLKEKEGYVYPPG